MRLNIEIDEHELRKILLEYLRSTVTPGVDLTEQHIYIETKSKQNCRSEWEPAAFRARVSRLV